MIKVIHVDSDAAVREMVDMVLCLTGEFVVLPCATGAEAVAQLNAFGPEVVLIDSATSSRVDAETVAAIHQMPGFQQTPVILLTAEDQADIATLRAAGAADVIEKPFDPMTLADRIKEALPALA